MPKKKLLGREIRIRKEVEVREFPAKAKTQYGTSYSVPFVKIDFGVGPEYVASLSMSKDAWEAFKKGARLNFQ